MLRYKRLYGIGLAILMLFAGHSANTKPVKPKPPRADGLVCAPQVLTSKDQLTIRLKLPHGGELAIINPANDFIYIAFADEVDSSFFHPIIPGDVFLKQDQVTLSAVTAKGMNTWHDTERATRIFTRNGRYKIAVSKNFDDDLEPWAWCEVDYRDPADPRPPPKPRIVHEY